MGDHRFSMSYRFGPRPQRRLALAPERESWPKDMTEVPQTADIDILAVDFLEKDLWH